MIELPGFFPDDFWCTDNRSNWIDHVVVEVKLLHIVEIVPLDCTITTLLNLVEDLLELLHEGCPFVVAILGSERATYKALVQY